MEEEPPLDIQILVEHTALTEAITATLAFFCVAAEKEGWWAREQIIEVFSWAKDHPTAFPIGKEMTDIYNKEWHRFFSGLEHKLKYPKGKDPKLKDPRDLWRVIPGGKA